VQQEAPPRPTLELGLGLERRSPPRPTLGLGLDFSLGKSHILARPWASAPASASEELSPRPTSGSDQPCHGGCIITLLLASSGYEGTRPTSHPAYPGNRRWWFPACNHDVGGSQAPYRSKETSAGSIQYRQLYCYRAQGTPPTATILPLQDLRHPPADTFLSVQGSGHSPASHIKLPATPHCTAGHLLTSMKGGVQGPTRGGQKKGREDEGTSIRTYKAYVRTAGEDEQGPDPLSLALCYSPSLALTLSQGL
jgi:hypothetical protein